MKNIEITPEIIEQAKDRISISASNIFAIEVKHYIDLINTTCKENELGFSISDKLIDTSGIVELRKSIKNINDTVFEYAQECYENDDSRLNDEFSSIRIDSLATTIIDGKAYCITMPYYYRQVKDKIPYEELPEHSKDEYVYYISSKIGNQNKLGKIVDEIESAISRAESFAIKHDLSFSLSPAYGMGGNFSSGVWQASSESC